MRKTTPSSSSAVMNEPDEGIPGYDTEPESGKELTKDDLNGLRKKGLEKKLVDWVRSEYQKCKSAHTGIRNQWYMNLAFYKGDQYVQKIAGQVVRSYAARNRVRLVINRVRPMIRTEISRMTSQKPTAEVVPASTDQADMLSAEAGQAVFENVSYEYHLADKYIDAAFWQSVCGVGYIKTRWDNKGKNGPGCHDYSVPTPFHVLVPDLTVTDIEEQPYVLNIYTKPVEWVKLHYKDLLPDDYKPTVVSTSEIMETQYLNMKESDRKAEPDSSLFIEAWIKPGVHPDFPDGGMMTVMDNVLLQMWDEGLPYEHGMYPFTKFDGVPSGGYYSTSAIEDFVQLQMELNRNRSQRSEARNMTANPQWMAAKGSVDVNKWTNAPGAVLLYNPGLGEPKPVPMTSLPNYVLQEEDALLRDMEDVSGQHQISRGQNPSGVTSGTAISFLQESDNSFMATVFLSIERGFQKIAKQTLMLAVQYWDTPRIVKVTGDNFSVRKLTGADIKTGTDIRIETGSSLPVSRAARNAMFMDMMAKGQIPVQEGLRLLSIPGMKELFNRMDVDKNQAQREHLKLMELDPAQVEMARMQAEQMKAQALQGVDPMLDPQAAQLAQMFDQPILPVNEWDNHEAHINEHGYFMKSQTFEALPQSLKDELERHWKAHKDMMVKQMFEQSMMGGMDMGQAAAQDMSAQNGAGNNTEGDNQFSGLPSDNASPEQGVAPSPTP